MKKGFTLLELIIVIVVIAVLASIALPQMIKVIRRARAAEALTCLDALRNAQLRYFVSKAATGTGTYAAAVGDTDYDSQTLKYHSAPTVSSSDPVASVATTTTPTYTLTITAAGAVVCSGTGCPDIGY